MYKSIAKGMSKKGDSQRAQHSERGCKRALDSPGLADVHSCGLLFSHAIPKFHTARGCCTMPPAGKKKKEEARAKARAKAAMEVNDDDDIFDGLGSAALAKAAATGEQEVFPNGQEGADAPAGDNSPVYRGAMGAEGAGAGSQEEVDDALGDDADDAYLNSIEGEEEAVGSGGALLRDEDLLPASQEPLEETPQQPFVTTGLSDEMSSASVGESVQLATHNISPTTHCQPAPPESHPLLTPAVCVS